MNKRCVGCGVILQDKDEKMDGFVVDINQDKCKRCFMIKNYGQRKDTDKNNSDYLKILNDIKDNDLVVYVSSLLTLNLDYLDRFKRVILVLTKRDVLPKSVKDEKIINYIKDRYNNVLNIEIVSAYKKYNLDCLYNKLIKYGKNKKIYFVGITNSGKSTLINEMIKSYGNKIGQITTSSFPSTTLGIVSNRIGELIINDTPGIVVEDSVINYLDEKGINRINSKKEIKPITFQIKGHGAILIEEMIGIEYITDSSSLTVYVSNNLNVDRISLNNPRIKMDKKKICNLNDNQDVVIEDIGFVKCTKGCKINIYYKDNLMIRVRDNLI